MPLDLNALLIAEGINPETVLVMRHRPYEPKLAKAFAWLPEDRIDLFEAYQQSHGERVESSLGNMKYVASFVGLEPQTATFVGLYRNCGNRSISLAEYRSIPAITALVALGMEGWQESGARTTMLLFDLQRTDFYANWKGRLKVRWSPPERSWWRRAHRNTMDVLSIAEESAFSPPLADWREIVLGWGELNLMGSRMRMALSQWRGVYLIRDASDGRCYVGSAGGSENLLGRWRGYAESGHGGNKRLRQRDPKNFVFSILQRTSPDMLQDELVQLENSWKQRLHTRAPDGLNDN